MTYAFNQMTKKAERRTGNFVKEKDYNNEDDYFTIIIIIIIINLLL